MANLDDDIRRITDECLRNGTVEEIIQKKVVAGFEEAITDAFKWGDLNKAIRSKINSVLVPYIENYDMSEYIVKLDTILSEIVKQTMLVDNKKILENFKSLMIEPNQKTITVSELFKIYNKWIAKDIETSGRNVNYDGNEPEYKSIETNVDFEKDEERRWSLFDYGTLEFTVNEEDKHDEFNRTIRLSRYKNDKDEKWDITYKMPADINSLRTLNDFDIFLMKLERANVKVIIDTTYDSDDITPDIKPELTYE